MTGGIVLKLQRMGFNFDANDLVSAGNVGKLRGSCSWMETQVTPTVLKTVIDATIHS